MDKTGDEQWLKKNGFGEVGQDWANVHNGVRVNLYRLDSGNWVCEIYVAPRREEAVILLWYRGIEGRSAHEAYENMKYYIRNNPVSTQEVKKAIKDLEDAKFEKYSEGSAEKWLEERGFRKESIMIFGGKVYFREFGIMTVSVGLSDETSCSCQIDINLDNDIRVAVREDIAMRTPKEAINITLDKLLNSDVFTVAMRKDFINVQNVLADGYREEGRGYEEEEEE